MHRLAGRRRIRQFHLESVALALLDDHQVELGALVRCPEVRLIRLRNRQNLLDRETPKTLQLWDAPTIADGSRRRATHAGCRCPARKP